MLCLEVLTFLRSLTHNRIPYTLCPYLYTNILLSYWGVGGVPDVEPGGRRPPCVQQPLQDGGWRPPPGVPEAQPPPLHRAVQLLQGESRFRLRGACNAFPRLAALGRARANSAISNEAQAQTLQCAGSNKLETSRCCNDHLGAGVEVHEHLGIGVLGVCHQQLALRPRQRVQHLRCM